MSNFNIDEAEELALALWEAKEYLENGHEKAQIIKIEGERDMYLALPLADMPNRVYTIYSHNYCEPELKLVK